MKIIAMLALVALVSCASPETQSASAEHPQQATTTAPTYEDARSVASDAEVRDARRAYRSACQQSRSDGWCECMTGGMAQALPPAELAIATAAFTGQNVQGSEAARQHVAQTRAAVEASCTQYR